MSNEELEKAFGLLPPCLIDYIVGAMLYDLACIQEEDKKPARAREVRNVLRIYTAA